MESKRMHLVLVLTISLFVLATPYCFADTIDSSGDKEYEWTDKLGRGLANVFTSPVEIIRGIDLTSKEDGPAKGWTIGFVKGIAGGVLRLGAGLVDFVTFPFGFPEETKGPIIKPAFVWEDWVGPYME